MQKPLIGLLDCNNFFVSCERLFRPDLRTKPVVVLSSNDGCVVARSQEVKDMGIPMGVPYFKIKDILKNKGVFVFSSHFALYRDISRRVIAVMREELDFVEQYSVDEAFFTVEDDPKTCATRVKEVVEKQVGIPVSVGIAATKTQAKYANETAKKGEGIEVFRVVDWARIAPSVRLAEIWGVGGNLDRKYKQLGIYTVQDLLNADPARIDRIFGIAGLRLQQELAGTSVFKLHARREPQHSIMSSRSFKHEVLDKETLFDAVAYHVRHVAADLRQMKQEGRVIRVSIRPSRHGDFVLRGGSAEAILPAASNDTLELLKVAHSLTEQLFESGVPYKKAGVVMSALEAAGSGQKDLFNSDGQKNKRLLAAVDALNRRADRELITFGSRLKTTAWQTRIDERSPAYTTKWTDVSTVRTN